jgi:hypothetical protein
MDYNLALVNSMAPLNPERCGTVRESVDDHRKPLFVLPQPYAQQ